MWFKKPLIAFFLGVLAGKLILAIVAYPIHLNSKRLLDKSFQKTLAEKNALIKECIERPTYTNNNAFNHNVGKNKKAVIEVNTCPNIEQALQIEKLKDTLQVEATEKPKTKRRRKPKKRR